jgi:AcrR family transcriptional regulator
VIALAGVGRNTFYEHFSDAEDALRAVQREAARALARALDDAFVTARTPVERLRALSLAWLTTVAGEPAARALLHAADGPRSPRAELRHHVERLLASVVAEARAAGRASLAPDRVRIAAVGGAFEQVAREVVDDPAAPRAEVAEVLVDLVLRSFR